MTCQRKGRVFARQVDDDQAIEGCLSGALRLTSFAAPQVAKMGVASVAEAVLADEGLKGTLSSIYVSPQWQDGSVCSTLASESSSCCAMRCNTA